MQQESSFMVFFFSLPLLSLVLSNQPATALSREMSWGERPVYFASTSEWVTFAFAPSGKS